ncbi:hypothetical protein FJR37_25025 [Aphanizomenon sp. UHCC 0183]|nr:hypothetical protein [Aphanizomenon sp. UHCC 0183]
MFIYSGFRSYEVHLSPLIACGEGVGGGVLVPHNTGKCCSFCVSSGVIFSLHHFSAILPFILPEVSKHLCLPHN